MTAKVKFVKYIQGGYQGMNPAAAKELGVSCPPNTILILKNLSPKQKRKTITHERIEYGQMKSGKKYKPADAVATALTRSIYSRRRKKK